MPEPEPGSVNPDNRSAGVAPPEGANVVDAGAELAQSVVAYVRQEIGDVVREKVVLPVQTAGGTVGLAIGVALVLFLGIAFVAVGALILLAMWIGWPAALFLVGGLLILGAAGIGYARMRSMQS